MKDKYKPNRSYVWDFSVGAMQKAFERASKGGLLPLIGVEFCSELGRTLEEMEYQASLNSYWNRHISFYKQKCHASIIAGFKEDPKGLLKYYELQYTSQGQGKEDQDNYEE